MKKLFTMFGAAMLCLTADSFAQNIVFQNFETASVPGLPSGWTQGTKATTGWKTNRGTVVSTAGWATPAHGTYAIVDDWNNNEPNDSTILISPTFSLVGHPNAMVGLDYYFVGASYSGNPLETAFLLVSSDGGAHWNQLDSFKGNSSQWQTSFQSLSAYAGMANMKIGIRYNDGSGGAQKLIGCAVDNIKVFDPLPNDISLHDVTPVDGSPTDYAVASNNLTLGGSILNYGTTAVTTFTVFFQLGNGTIVSNPFTGVNVPQYGTYAFTCPNPLALPATLGNYPVKMWVSMPGDADASDDSNATAVNAVAYMPGKKLLVEEGTGTWCGWCPRGAVYMDSLWNTYPSKVSLVAVHNSDPMTVTAYDAFVGTKISGYPSVIVDRREVYDPSDLIDVYDREKDYFGFADITLTPIDAPEFDISVKATVKPALDMSGDYRLALALTEDNVHGSGSSTWDQHDYYSSASQNIPLVGAGHDWQAEPAVIPAARMYYQFVARQIVPSVNGAAGSLPATMNAGNTYDYTFNVPNVAQPYNRANMRYVVMLIRNSDGAVLNSNYAVVAAGIKNVSAGINEFTVYPNPATDKAFISFNLKENTNVTVQVMNGMGRVVYTIPAQDMQSGSHHVEINTSNLATGSYIIKMQTEKGNLTQHLSVVK